MKTPIPSAGLPAPKKASEELFGPDFCLTWAELMVVTMVKRGIKLCVEKEALAKWLGEADMSLWNICFHCGYMVQYKKDCCEEHRYQHTLHSLAV